MQHVAAIDNGAIGTFQEDHDPYGENSSMLASIFTLLRCLELNKW
jgi:hypothetical protein